MSEEQAYMLEQFHKQYPGYKFIHHRDKNDDYIEKEGFIFRKPTGYVIKKENFNWEIIDASCKAQVLFSAPRTVYSTFYFHFDHKKKIALYRY